MQLPTDKIAVDWAWELVIAQAAFFLASLFLLVDWITYRIPKGE